MTNVLAPKSSFSYKTNDLHVRGLIGVDDMDDIDNGILIKILYIAFMLVSLCMGTRVWLKITIFFLFGFAQIFFYH